jgi:cytochrome c oxidase subunit IV
MSGHSPEEIKLEQKRYLTVFIVLIIGTILTVGASYIELPTFASTVALALFIASIKGFCVAGYFMHLMDEKKMIYGIMGATVFFVIGLMVLTIWASGDPIPNTIYP